jgi:hypothetical protein
LPIIEKRFYVSSDVHHWRKIVNARHLNGYDKRTERVLECKGRKEKRGESEKTNWKLNKKEKKRREGKWRYRKRKGEREIKIG